MTKRYDNRQQASGSGEDQAGALNAVVSALAALTVDEETVRGALARILAPTLVLWGTGDNAIPRALIDDLAAAHPDWAFHPFDGLGHMIPWEAPTAYVSIVASWAGSVWF
jgi:pimeloyl-ACP methyl ester carboxylesterase